MHRVTVEEASRLLGIEKESVRKRVYRGQLRADKEPDGTLRVYVDDVDGVRGPSMDDVHGHESDGVRDEVVATLRDQIEHMRRESERKDAIIMQMAQANAALASRVPELEAPKSPREWLEDEELEREDRKLSTRSERVRQRSHDLHYGAPQKARGGPQTTADEPEEANSHLSAVEAQEGAERPSWWRRLFGV